MPLRRSGRLAIAAGVSAILIAMLFVVGSYASALGGCESCHSQVSATCAKGTHSAVACVRCHVPSSPAQKFRFGVRVVTGMRLGLVDVGSGDVLDIPNQRCESCHTMTGDKVGVVGRAVRINHAACVPGQRCTKCHGTVVHGADQQNVSGTDMFECLVCHISVGQTVECDGCHQGRLARDRIQTGTFAVTHGKNWKRDHGIGSVVACAACHDQSKCFKCHGVGVPHATDFMRNHGEFAQSIAQRCATCHRPLFCDSCHGVEMPHPDNFKQVHAAVVKRQGEKACKKCHADSDCVTCHTMHVHPGGAVGGARP